MKKTTNIQDIITDLKAGKVVSFPTDTVYAIAALTTAYSAVEDIYRLKNRHLTNPLAVLAPSTRNLRQYVVMSDAANTLAETFMPGPFTLVLPKQKECSVLQDINPEYQTVGVRVPDHPIAVEILSSIDQPIVATSANISGMKPAISWREVEEYFDGADLTLLQCDTPCSGVASTIVEIQDGVTPIMLREGEISNQQIQQVLKLAG